MGQQAGTSATWRNQNRRISQDLPELWDSTRANSVHERAGKNVAVKKSKMRFEFCPQIPEETAEFCPRRARCGMLLFANLFFRFRGSRRFKVQRREFVANSLDGCPSPRSFVAGRGTCSSL